MKKIMFVMPLVAVSLLASCGGNKEPTKVSYTLTYTYNNGTDNKYVETYTEDKKTEKPTWVPENPGNTFEGWFTESGEEGTQFTFGNVLTNNTVVYAHWRKTPEPKTTYHLTFKGTHCKMDGDDTYEEDIPINTSTQRKIYPDEGYALPVLGEGELVIEGDGASSITYENGIIIITELSGNVVITASSSLKKYTVHFDAKDGDLDSQAQENITVTHGDMFKKITNYDNQKATKSGCYFKGWSLSPTDISTMSGEYIFKDDESLFAVFTPITSISVKLSNNSSNCTLSTKDGQEAAPGGTVNVPVGFETTLIISPINNYLPVFSKNLEVSGTTDYEFDQATKELTITVSAAGCEITAKAPYLSKGELNNYSWEEINSISEDGGAPVAFEIGDEKLVNVNGKDHRVRIIGFNHDELASSPLANPEFAGITFEFANFISDLNGFSLATLWNWESGDDSTNENYLDSNLRKAIDGGGSQDTHLNWYQINGTKTSENYKTSVLDMITSNPDNEELKDALKEVRKPIAIKSSDDYIVNKTSYTTKLFPLSYREITEKPHDYAKEEGKTYEFYKGDEGDADDNRIKWQVNHNEGATHDYIEIDDEDKIWGPWSFAGYNYSTDYGGTSWLRSPRTNDDANVWADDVNGGLVFFSNPSKYALAVAPAFCV